MKRRRFSCAFGLLLFSTLVSASCLRDAQQVQKDPPLNSPEDKAAQKRDDDFRWKERCAIAAERFDKLFAPTPETRASHVEFSVSEAFYSPSRNSCVCELSSVGPTGPKSGLQNQLTLYDCLTREELSSTLIDFNGNYGPAQAAAWKLEKEHLKGASPTKQ